MGSSNPVSSISEGFKKVGAKLGDQINGVGDKFSAGATNIAQAAEDDPLGTIVTMGLKPTIQGVAKTLIPGQPDIPAPGAPAVPQQVDPAVLDQLRRQRMLSQYRGSSTSTLLGGPSLNSSGQNSLGSSGGKAQLGY